MKSSYKQMMKSSQKKKLSQKEVKQYLTAKAVPMIPPAKIQVDQKPIMLALFPGSYQSDKLLTQFAYKFA